MRGVRVLELSESVAGAYCTRVLGALGADVVMLEPSEGSALRREGPWIPDPTGRPLDPRGRSALHEHLNYGKRSIVANGEGLDRLIRWADIVVSGCDGEPAAALALHDHIAALNPAAVHVVTSGFGLSGPLAAWKHSPLIDWASGGHLYLTGEPGRAPLTPGSPLNACLAGAAAAVGAQAALFDRTCTGLGQLVDVGAMECGAAAHQWSIVMYTHTGAVKRRWGALLGEAYHPMALFRCRDGWVCIGAATLAQWEAFCIALDVPDLLADERLNAPAERFERAAEIDARVQPFLQQHSAAGIVEILQAARVPASRLLDYTETLEAGHLKARDLWADLPGAPGGKVPRAPFVLSRSDRRDRPAPAPEEHTADVLAGLDGATRPEHPRLDLSTKRVAEFTLAWAGPLAGRFLADLGMEVIKVEHPAGRGPPGGAQPAAPLRWGDLPDPLIRAPVYPHAEPGERRWNRSAVINKLGRGKRSLALDVKAPGGEAVLARLLASADAVLHNFSPRGADSLGIDRASIEAHRPNAVTVAMTGYGETGPMRDFGAYGPLLEAFGGVDQAMGYEGEGPMRIGVAYPDAIGGALGAAAVLGGLWEQAAGGGGPVHADLSQLEGLLSFAGEALVAASVHGAPPARRGNSSPDHAPHGVFPCQGDDVWVAVAVRSDDEWRALAGLIGDARADLTVEARQADRAAIEAAISAWTSRRTAMDAAIALQAAGVPACPAFTNRDLVESEHLAARGFIVTLDQADAGPQRFPGFPLHFSRRQVMLKGPPGLGQHNAEVLASLGYAAQEIADLAEAEVIADRPPG
ncbi:CaiB/BaiF CoA-transferase family protein [Phenylobacterium sp.]|uniref:CaiB/BaiF CoA transferase family protein n=1 Tax=Phenylobacterium sp. TaxID=1871053 RepID=UPI0025CF63E8|nr:CoA transferase [Phenylobacterium sp.]MBX3483055.1 CoA transferase [Phenylobacterium sp.]MCW5758717.1 CoA transferase [Phenylobacterium sp.]